MGYFRDKTILITGAGSGLGRRMALAMAAEGARIVAWDIAPAALEDLRRALAARGGNHHLGFVCDVSDREAVYRTAEEVMRQAGRVDILINNAGVVSGRPFLECSDQQIQHTLGVNTLALFWTAKAFLPAMVARNSGHVVTVASAAGLIGAARLTDYSASKFAAVGFDEALRVELGRIAPGVKTTVICPYYIDTGMFAGVRTRFPGLLPIMSEEYAARRMVAAIRRRQARLIMPPLVLTIPLLRLLPVRLGDRIAGWLGVNVSMDHFTGRT
jgi:all-trans-retinol dehydrogenase (NAD+)